MPALQVTRLDIREALNQESRGGGSGGVRHQRMRSSLVVAEIALALMLLVGADVARLVVGEAARLAFTGIALGLAGAAAMSQLLRTILFDAGGLDPLAFVVAPIALAIAALVAAWLPARRASNVPPIVALGR